VLLITDIPEYVMPLPSKLTAVAVEKLSPSRVAMLIVAPCAPEEGETEETAPTTDIVASP
jgi:hypothetical protein